MWFRIILLLLSFYSLSFSASQKNPTELDPKLGFVANHIISNGLDRTYHVKLPSNTQNKPVLFLLHDGGKNFKDMMEGFGNILLQHAQLNDFIVVIPEALKSVWSDGRNSKSQFHKNKEIEDVRFFKEIIGKLDNQYAIDKRNLFFVGASNGGMMNYRLVCEIPEYVNSIASITASFPVGLEGCQNKTGKRIGILIMNGTDDKWIPWKGGAVMPFSKQDHGEVYSAEYTRDFFLKFNALSGTEASEYALEDITKIDDSHVSISEYDNDLHFYTVYGGGHTVPGSYTEQFHFKSRVRYERFGATNMDFSAPDKIFDFIWSHLKY